jgi:hypothetical protein
MQKLMHSPKAIVRMFNNLCLNHVKDQLVENLNYFTDNPTSFILDGDLFVYTPSRSLIVDESLNEYGGLLEKCKVLN